MTIYDTILETYTELTTADFNPISGSILLKDDGDGIVYLAKWEYAKPIPEGMKLGK
jgi:hypothetical protein